MSVNSSQDQIHTLNESGLISINIFLLECALSFSSVSFFTLRLKKEKIPMKITDKERVEGVKSVNEASDRAH